MTYSNANFTPSLKGYSNVKPFRFWCQKVLPLVYDDSLSYYELLCKVVDYLNNVISDLSATEDNIGDLLTAYNQLQDYVNNYFTNLDVQEEINTKLDAMFEDGTIPTMIEEYVHPFIETLNENYAELDEQINETMDTQNENIATLAARVNNLVINNTTNLTGYNVVTVESTTAQGGSTVTENIPKNAEILQVCYSGYNDSNDTIKSANINYVSTPNAPSSTQQQVVVTITDSSDTRFNVFITYAVNQAIEIAELTDIRLGYDDIEYSSAGNAVRGQVSDLKNTLNEIKDTYGTRKNIITSTTEVNGKYINNEGTEANQDALGYKQTSIDSSLVGKEILITGTGWYSIKPYVFVPTSGTPIYPSVNPGSTVTQYTDLSFTPQTTGTLYVNRYTSSPSQIGEAYYQEISNVKAEYITSIDGVKDAVFYKVISLEMTSGKLLNGNTGVITDNTSEYYKVSQYVAVSEDTDYLITTENFWSNGLYAWYDSNKNFISGVSSQSGGTMTKIYCQKVRSPKNAAYLVVGFLYQTNFQFPFLMEGENKSIMPSKRWSGKKWTCVGDSLTEAYSVTGAHYFDLISAATGIETVNKGVSGTGYARGTDNFMTRALTVPTDSDVVTFFGSGNDSGAGLPLGTASDTGTDTLGGCINTAIDNLYSIMPVVQLGIVTPTPWQGNMPYDNGWMANYSALIVDICKRRSIPCLDLFHCSNLNPNSAEVRQIAYARDNGGGVHPSEVGHAIIAPRFLAFLESLLMH